MKRTLHPLRRVGAALLALAALCALRAGLWYVLVR